jgi:hypothetical protein
VSDSESSHPVAPSKGAVSPRSAGFPSRPPDAREEAMSLIQSEPPPPSQYGARNSVNGASISATACSASRWPAPRYSGVGSGVEVELITISFHKTYHVTRACSLDHHGERLTFVDGIRGELRRVGDAYVLQGVDRFGWNEKTSSALNFAGDLSSTCYSSATSRA